MQKKRGLLFFFVEKENWLLQVIEHDLKLNNVTLCCLCAFRMTKRVKRKENNAYKMYFIYLFMLSSQMIQNISIALHLN